MSEQVRVKYDADMAAFFREAKKATEEQRKFVSELRKTKGASKEAEDSSAKWLGGMASQLTTVLGGIASVGTAIRVVNNEMEELARKQKEALQQTITYEQALAQMALNFPDISTAADAERRVRSTQARYGGDLSSIARAYATVPSARPSGTTPEDAFGAVDFGARISRSTGYAPEMVAGGTLDLMGITGDVSPGAGVAWGLGVAAQSRVEDFGQVLNVAPRVIRDIMGEGVDAGQAAATWAVMTRQIGDTEGRIAGTAGRQTVATLMTGAVIPGRRGQMETLPEDAGNVPDRLRALRAAYMNARPTEREAIMRSIPSGRGMGALRMYVQGHGDLAGEIESTMRQIPATGAGLEEGFIGRLEHIESRPGQATTQIQQLGAAAGQAAFVDAEGMGRAGAYESVLDDFAGVYWGATKQGFYKKGFRGLTALGEDPGDVTKRLIESERYRSVRQVYSPEQYQLGLEIPPAVMVPRDLTEWQATTINRFLDALSVDNQEQVKLNSTPYREDMQNNVGINELAIDQRRRENIGDSY